MVRRARETRGRCTSHRRAILRLPPVSEGTLFTLLLIFAGAALSPIVADVVPRGLLPAVVIEILFGIVLGPHGFDVGAPSSVIEVLAALGLGSLMFLAGYEIDFAEIRGRPLNLAMSGWAVSLGLGLAAGYLFARESDARGGLLVGLALTTTALSTLLPILTDSGRLHSAFGVRVLAIGSVGEFGPILAIAVLFGTDSPATTILLLALFTATALVAARLAVRPSPPRLARLAAATLSTSGQLSVRIAVLLLVALVWLAVKLSLDVLLGAFTAGMIFRLFVSADDPAVRRSVEEKIKAIGFGFLIPLFFVVTGMRFDLDPLIDRPDTVLLLAGFAVLLLVVRGVPILVLHRRDGPVGQRVALALMASTGLPIIVVITTIGISTGRLVPDDATALVGAGMLSVLLYPTLALVAIRLGAGPSIEPGSAAR